MKKCDASLEEIQRFVKESTCISQVVIALKLPCNAKYAEFVRQLISQHALDTSHFTRKRKYERIRKACPVCQTTFETYVNHPKYNKTTCSCACANSFFRSGNNNPNTKHDEDKGTWMYTLCWKNHEHQCVICGEQNIVAVHHFNGKHDDNRPENLVPMCPTHHQYWHSKFRSLIEEKVNTYVENWISTHQRLV